jgi:hypothetical protein
MSASKHVLEVIERDRARIEEKGWGPYPKASCDQAPHILAKHGRHSHDAMFGDQKQRQLDDLDRLKGKYEQQI